MSEAGQISIRVHIICTPSALKIEPKLQIDPMGSYRRGEETSGDRE
jgi:hypothetical protein